MSASRTIAPAAGDAAVIDVGSNSVRLVLYRLDGRAIWTVFNEKVLAGLGRDLPTTGRLSPRGRRGRADRAAPLPRPAGRLAQPTDVIAAATAAVREAADGAGLPAARVGARPA